MKGVILAGGSGSRLFPLTSVTNKCLLPIYNKPMLFHVVESFVNSGIKDILLVCGGNAAGEFLRVLGNGEEFGLKHLHYTYQSEPRGIADALSLAEEWADGEPIAVLLADNIFEKPFDKAVEEFESSPEGARIFLTEVENPQAYGVVEIDGQGQVLGIEEKPKTPKSDLIATGLYFYDKNVWDFIKHLTPSARNELEITDVNLYYLGVGKLKAHRVDGWWADCGEDFDGYLDAGIKLREFARQNCTT
jgi:glucose-1-phosphate thymidylyltransferase